MILLDLLRSNTIIVDGGLAKNPLYLGFWQGCCRATILRNQNAEGTASALPPLAWEGQGRRGAFRTRAGRARLDMPGLGEYHRRWAGSRRRLGRAEG